ncbi:MAG: hypothetical protein LRY73_14230 [Bacillus sp. (in: Bacteria)]|nr:hypothetical protein [Bacillus sp. (in: firmicutes)]
MELFIVSSKDLIKVGKSSKGWSLQHHTHPVGDMQSVAFDENSGTLYAGTFDHGLWKSKDNGATWERIGETVFSNRVMTIRVSPNKGVNGISPVYAGTEPSNLYKSIDGGKTWTSFPALLQLPSKSTWFFPPRPYTHHVQDIAVGYGEENFLLTGIELGGVMRSLDGGETFEDRKEGSQFDCHTIKLHPNEPNRIYEAGGGGYAESRDKGTTWETINEGLAPYTYLVHVAVSPADPETVIASGAEGPRSAYRPEGAKTVLFRKTAKEEIWTRVTDGLPSPEESTVLHLHSHPEEPNNFYAVNNRGVFVSEDQGLTWEKAPIEWPEFMVERRINDVTLISR